MRLAAEREKKGEFLLLKRLFRRVNSLSEMEARPNGGERPNLGQLHPLLIKNWRIAANIGE